MSGTTTRGTAALEKWVEESAQLTKPERIVWCDGSEREYADLVAGMLRTGELVQVNERAYPNSYLHRSNPNDVARTEEVTLICTERQEDAGPTNYWEDPKSAKERVGKLFDGAMRGRTMYVVPYLMGPAGSPHAKVGVEITDSAYVVANLRITTRMGKVAMDTLEKNGGKFVPGLHSTGDLDPKKRWILHFPEEQLIWSIGSGYGGNALLGKKCLSLRLASWMGWKEGWMAEHMLILGLEDPSGNVTYMAGAFPSACGKTNLAMLVSPLAERGWRVWTVGDDIAWMRIGEDGRLWAVNPENGFFGVAPGTNVETNPNAMASLSPNSIFTNVGLTPDKLPWWEGIDPGVKTPPPGTINWLGHEWKPGDEVVAHPNSRFTAPASAVPLDLAALGRSAGCADLGLYLRRAARACGPAALPGVQLAARRLRRRGDGLGEDGGGGGQGRRDAPRPDGDAALLRLQHGRLLGPLAGDGREAGAPAGDLPRQLVPQG